MAKQAQKVEKKDVVSKPRELRDDEVRTAFKNYFVKIKRKLKLEPSLEQVLWLHLKATGNDKPDLFNKGIEHFGYKI